jgi:hypothetical protein
LRPIGRRRRPGSEIGREKAQTKRSDEGGLGDGDGFRGENNRDLYEKQDEVGEDEVEMDTDGIIDRIQGPSIEDQIPPSSTPSRPTNPSSATPPLPYIFRQSRTYTDSQTGRTFEVLLTSPVMQGVVKRGWTEIVLVPPISGDGKAGSGRQMDGNVSDDEEEEEVEVARRGARSNHDAISQRSISASRSLSISGSASASGSGSGIGRKKWGAGDFDPDTFLAGSLLRERDEDDDEEDGNEDAELKGEDEDGKDGRYRHLEEHGSDDDGPDENSALSYAPTPTLSVSSGSLTPRPFGSPVLVRHSSFSSSRSRSSESLSGEADSQVEEDVQARPGLQARSSRSKEKEEFRGVGFEGVCLTRMPKGNRRSKGKQVRDGDETTKPKEEGWPDEDSRCWLTMEGLARAGVFVGDWVR